MTEVNGRTAEAGSAPGAAGQTAAEHIATAEAYAAPNYHPLPVVLASGTGAWVTDVDGRRYLDCLAGYSALNFGHRHPALIAAATAQLNRLTLTSRAFHHDQLGAFCAELVELVRGTRPPDRQADALRVLPMNTGAEAVETAIKAARKWGYDVKGVPTGRATIVAASGNFHGRTSTIVSFSDDPLARDGFAPYMPGFRLVPYGDGRALADALDDTTVAVLLEPIQGEAGVIVPPPDYLPAVRRLCDERGALLIADEIQSGLGRTGKIFACEHAGVVPDLYLLGKALGGGIVPVSAVVGAAEVLDVLGPGTHGSTFGGNPLACAVGRAVVRLLAEGTYPERAAELGAYLHARLRGLVGRGVVAVRGVGLWAGVDVDPAVGSGRTVCERLVERGVLAKDTHGSTIRLAPPLVIEREDLAWAVDQLTAVLAGA